MRKKILSITKKDLTVQTFQSGGKGGQHQNRTNSGVRIIHKASGAVGECRNHKSQYQNKKEALRRLTDSKKFKIWINTKVHEIIEGKKIEEKELVPVEAIQFTGENFKVCKGFIGEKVEFRFSGDFRSDTQCVTQSILDSLQGFVKQYPEQWGMLRKIWCE